MSSDVVEIFSLASLGGYIGVCFIIVFVYYNFFNEKNTVSLFPLELQMFCLYEREPSTGDSG